MKIFGRINKTVSCNECNIRLQYEDIFDYPNWGEIKTRYFVTCPKCKNNLLINYKEKRK